MKIENEKEIIFNYLKELRVFPISAISLLEFGKNIPKEVKVAYENLDEKDEAELLMMFGEWTKSS